MNRLLKILLYAVVLFFLFLWLSTIVKSCGADKDATPPATTTADAEDNTEEAYDEEFFEENDGDEDTDVDPSDMSDGTEENIDYTEIDKVVEDKLNNNTTEPASSSTPATSTRPSSNNNSSKVTSGNNRGKYMVMAGSFLIEKNAEGLRKKLVNLGYNNADVVVFDLSQYHSVVAARFSTYEAALKVSNELKRRGMDCYVHAQQF